MDDILTLRLKVEDLLFLEADLLDRWMLKEWLALFTEDAWYHVPPATWTAIPPIPTSHCSISLMTACACVSGSTA
ncbi:hypothetical protein ACFSTD_19700 [Novosphingobium colocasiae]